ncbi:MAG: rod shape-determining protein RodA [Candidatus Levybacteria bacterium CG10_big_fil_rev_8_21_14_0_10_36_7]|nr:MAG: rod shape-determining protein RodA [Candidatus Levybacteria bacterium CG10_big_fil_rev_8_21_14_0_10_36_7]
MHRFSTNRLNFSILAPSVLLVFISLITFYSIDPELFRQQLVFFVVGTIAYFAFLNIDYRIFGFFSKYLYFLMLGLLLLLFVIGIEAKGAVRWLDIFGVRIQFSEIFKPFFIIALASFLTVKSNFSFLKFIKVLLLLVPIFFLILRQPDLGNAMIYLIVTIFMLFVYGFPLSYFVGLAIPAFLLMPIIFNFLHDYQKARILTFLSPTSDPLGSSYNAVQSLISVGSGGFFGKGFGQATQSILQFLPERHTDFIFATIAESTGLVGGLFLISLYTFLLYKIYKIGTDISDPFAKLIVSGFFFLLLTHIFLNTGMNTGLVPIVGITLPFVSYGGSSLLTNFIILGIISSIYFEYRKKKSMEIS